MHLGAYCLGSTAQSYTGHIQHKPIIFNNVSNDHMAWPATLFLWLVFTEVYCFDNDRNEVNTLTHSNVNIVHLKEMFLIDCTGRCQNKNFRCQWPKVRWRFWFHTEVYAIHYIHVHNHSSLSFEISFISEIQFIIFINYHIENRTRGGPN